jgi:energy-converting hydrogenase Eha subunit B
MPAMAAGTDVARTATPLAIAGGATATMMTTASGVSEGSIVTAMVTLIAMTYCWEDGIASTVTAMVTSIVGTCGLAVARDGAHAQIAKREVTSA